MLAQIDRPIAVTQAHAPAPDATAYEAPAMGEANPRALRLHSFSAIPLGESVTAAGKPDYARECQLLAHWVRGYLMRPHPQLGRSGAVCPFTSGAAKLDLIRIGASGAKDEASVHAVMKEALAAFEALACTRSQQHFRTVIIAFPDCADVDGVAALKRVQNRLRPESILRGKMIGLFEPESEATGLINPDFRPLRSPVPALAIRMLVENDAPFVMRNRLLAPIYLLKFPIAGARKLMRLLWK